MSSVKPIAIHLPQFHPIPENDEWWGKGFTEWTNVTRARPLFKGHTQPRQPADLGYYDLRVAEVREEQAFLAQENGIQGFMYYHYWFKGKRLLERPVNDILDSGKPNFPFCLCWANETWSRRWLGEESQILIRQDYSHEDDIAHALWLCRAFSDDRYIRVKGRPLFAIYRPMDFPDPAATIARIKETTIRAGLPEPYIIGSNSHAQQVDTRKFGVDAILNFEPQLSVLPEFKNDGQSWGKLRRNLKQGIVSPKLKVYDYRESKKAMQDRKLDYPFYPCIMVGWDNTPRRGKNAIVIKNQSPEVFENSLVWGIQKLDEFSSVLDDRILFINAWNEWAEGNYLEPSADHGHSYLDVVKKTFQP